MQRRSFFGGLFGGVVAWLLGTPPVAASPPYVTTRTGNATLFVSRAHSVGEFAGRRVTEGAVAGIPVKLIQYGNGKTVIAWDVTERVYCALDPYLRAHDPQSIVPTASLVITSADELHGTLEGQNGGTADTYGGVPRR